MRHEPSVTTSVVGDVARMLSAIELDDELLRQADEIDEIRPKRRLTTKLVGR